MIFPHEFVPQAVEILYITGDNEDEGKVGRGGAAATAAADEEARMTKATMAKRLATLYKYLTMVQMVNGGSSVTALEKVSPVFSIIPDNYLNIWRINVFVSITFCTS